MTKRLLATGTAVLSAIGLALSAAPAQAWPGCTSAYVYPASQTPTWASATASCSNAAQAKLTYRSAAGNAYSTLGPVKLEGYVSSTKSVTSVTITGRYGLALWYT